MRRLRLWFSTTPEIYSDKFLKILESHEKLTQVMEAIELDQNPVKSTTVHKGLNVKRVGSSQVSASSK